MKKSIIWLILSIQFIIMGCGGDSGGGSSTFQSSGNNPSFLSLVLKLLQKMQVI